MSTDSKPGDLIIEGARQHNLKNISLRIPHNQVTAITGVSGSGKSSLAFDTLFAEGQWRYVESLSTYARMFIEKVDRPDVDRLVNIRPAIAIEQKNPVRTARSTVGTATELADLLRLLFAKVGKPVCPDCGIEARGHHPGSVADELLSRFADARAMVLFPLKDPGPGHDRALIDSLLTRGFTICAPIPARSASPGTCVSSWKPAKSFRLTPTARASRTLTRFAASRRCTARLGMPSLTPAPLSRPKSTPLRTIP